MRALSFLPYLVAGLVLGFVGVSLGISIAVLIGLLFLDLLLRHVVARKRRAAFRESAPAPAASIASREQIRKLATRGLTLGVGHGRLADELVRWLEPGEAVLALTMCTHAGRWWQELRTTKSGRVLVATDRRLLLVPTGLVLADDPATRARFPPPETVPYGDVELVEIERGRLEAKLNVYTTAGVVQLTSMRGKNALAVATVVRAGAHRQADKL